MAWLSNFAADEMSSKFQGELLVCHRFQIIRPTLLQWRHMSIVACEVNDDCIVDSTHFQVYNDEILKLRMTDLSWEEPTSYKWTKS